VVTVTLAVVEPDATVTEDATFAAEDLELERATLIPPLPADPVSVTVRVTFVLLPPTTDVGETDRLASMTGVMVSVAEAESPFAVALMVAVVEEVTAVVVTVNVAEVFPAATVTDVGGLA